MRLAVIVFCAALALTCVAGHSGKSSNDLIIGGRIHGDYLLEQQTVEKSGFPLLVADKTVTIDGDGNARITSIEIFDLKSNGHNAKPAILKGGPGQTFVSINFKSNRGHGIHYLVKVYGK